MFPETAPNSRQRPFQAAFSDKVCIDEARLYMGEWAAAFGRQEATHSGEFLGIAATGKRIEIQQSTHQRLLRIHQLLL